MIESRDAKAVSTTYCNASRWRHDALAALQLAKDLESVVVYDSKGAFAGVRRVT